MNKKLVKEFLTITFAIMIVFWGGCALISQMFNLTVNNIFLRIMHIIGGFSPTIASYISLKRNGKVKNFKEWLKNIFDIKHNLGTYLIVVLFVLIYYVLGCVINGFEFGAPIFMILVIAPMMLVGGGNEEVGWRMILQPELEKKFGFNLATIFTAIIWWLWHLPIFFIKGTANINMNYFLFGIMCLTLSYALATIKKISKGVFPCILAHCLINGFSAIFIFSFSGLSCSVTLIVTILVSILILNMNKKCTEREENYMSIVEVELPIKGNKEDIDKMLLNNGFEEFYKVITISSYYKLKEDNDLNHSTLKSRCKRIRYVEPLVKFKNDYQNYKEWIKEYKYEECLNDENTLLNNGYEKIYTDEKTDYVYKNKNEKDMYFQIQDIKGYGLIIAYDNKNYYELDEITQREKLIQDILKYGIEILDEENVDRFKLIGKTLSIKEIVDKMNDVILNLK